MFFLSGKLREKFWRTEVEPSAISTFPCYISDFFKAKSIFEASVMAFSFIKGRNLENAKLKHICSQLYYFWVSYFIRFP